jgi:hypothetical protein
MYCIDKLNQFADISFGDNYTGKNISMEGSNSIIIRTANGNKIMEMMDSIIETSQSIIDDIHISQHIATRAQNYEFSIIKGRQVMIDMYPQSHFEKTVVSKTTSKIMGEKLCLINSGRNYGENSIAFNKRIKYVKIRNFAGRVKRFIIKRLRGYKSR